MARQSERALGPHQAKYREVEHARLCVAVQWHDGGTGGEHNVPPTVSGRTVACRAFRALRRTSFPQKSAEKLVPPARFEHAAYGLGNRRSIRLSYGGIGSRNTAVVGDYQAWGKLGEIARTLSRARVGQGRIDPVSRAAGIA